MISKRIRGEKKDRDQHKNSPDMDRVPGARAKLLLLRDAASGADALGNEAAIMLGLVKDSFTIG